MDATLKLLVEAPLANPLKLNVPMGRRSAPRGSKPVYVGDMGGEPLSQSELRTRRDNEKAAKVVSVLDYYATTQVPFDRIASHVKMTEDEVRAAMQRRGRVA